MAIDAYFNNTSGFTKHLKSRGKLPATIDSYKRDVNNFCDYLHSQHPSLYEISMENLINYQNHLETVKKRRRNSIRRATISLRQFFRF